MEENDCNCELCKKKKDPLLVVTSHEVEEYKEDKPGILDSIIQKVMSRKLIVWLTATVLLCLNKLNSEQWMYVAAIYLGSTALIELMGMYKGEGNT